MVNAQSKQSIRKPSAVLISDIHFNIQNLSLATAALSHAVMEANRLGLTLIVAGDMHDSKANIRGECVKAILDTLDRAITQPIVIVANHDRINERSPEHSLEFLRNTVQLVTEPTLWENIYLFPYYHDPSALRSDIARVPKGSTLIMHQGIEGSNMGDYIQDKSALNPEDVASIRVISGHYHSRQTIELPEGGKWDYIGNPYTLSFGEANDPPKGFQILYDDGSLEFVPTNLRKHIKWDIRLGDFHARADLANRRPNQNDLLWVRISGPAASLAKLSKSQIKEDWSLDADFRLEFISDDVITEIPEIEPLSKDELFDSLIDSASIETDQKNRLKSLWKDLLK